MRQIAIIVALLAALPNVSAQQWCPPGAEWRYPYITLLHPEQGILRYTYEGDSLYQGLVCQHFESRVYFPDQMQSGPWHSFTTTAPGVILFWNTLVSQFDTLVNFDAVPGTGWSFRGFQNQDYFITVQDTGTSIMNGIQLRYLVITSDPDWFGLPADTIFERVGALGLHNFSPIESYFMESPTLNGLGCYRDNELQYTRPFPTWLETLCDVSLTAPEQLYEADIVLKVYPNPGTDHVRFTGGSTAVRISVYDMLGALVLERNAVDPLSGMDLSILKQGIYTLVLRPDEGKVRHLKWIKE